MKFRIGDTLLLNCDQGVLYMVRATQGMVIDRDKATAIFEKLFRDKVGTDGRNT
jgi:hypothetical protein